MTPRGFGRRTGRSRHAFWIAGSILLASLAGAAVLLRSGPESSASRAHAPGETRYYCPMHPSYQLDHPGNCPICSMKLVPLEDGAAQPAAESFPSVQISPERQQQIGMRFAPVARVPATVEVRAVGKVAFDESQITHVHTKVNGWIEEVFV